METAHDEAMTTDEAITWLDKHSIDTQLVGGQLQAKEIWVKDGRVYEEWSTVTCERSWLHKWMNY